MSDTAANIQENTSQHEGSTSIQRESHGHFAKGKSANPGGRAKMPTEIREMLNAKAKDAVEIYIKHLGDTDPRVSLKAAELILDRAYGKTQPANEAVSFELPDDTGNADALVLFHASLLRATANGEVSVSDAMDLSGLFENHRRLIEVADLEQRLVKLEARQK